MYSQIQAESVQEGGASRIREVVSSNCDMGVTPSGTASAVMLSGYTTASRLHTCCCSVQLSAAGASMQLYTGSCQSPLPGLCMRWQPATHSPAAAADAAVTDRAAAPWRWYMLALHQQL